MCQVTNLRIHIFHQDPEGLRLAVHLVVPLEVGRDGQLHPQCGARDRLDVRGELEARELVNVAMERPAQFGSANQLAQFPGAQFAQPLPREGLLLELAHNLVGQLAELAQGRHALPHAAVHHLAEGEGLVHQLRPTPERQAIIINK